MKDWIPGFTKQDYLNVAIYDYDLVHIETIRQLEELIGKGDEEASSVWGNFVRGTRG